MRTVQNFSFKKEHMDDLRKLKEITGAPMSWHVEQALDKYLSDLLYGEKDVSKNKSNS